MLENYNPWWDDNPDIIYDELLQSKLYWIPDILNEFSINPYSLHFIVGPRQVGKSTALRIYIHQLLDSGFDSQQICLLPCDLILDYKELNHQIEQFLDSTKDETRVLLLDEITFVNNWWRTIKDLYDRGVFLKMVIFISGSASMELLKQKEYFPGRRGNGKDFILYPLDFNAYLRHIGGLTPENRIVKSGVIGFLKKYRLRTKKIKKLYEQYLITGGFPHSILEYINKKRVSFLSYNIYIDWIKNDIVKMGLSEATLKEILRAVLNSLSSPVSYNGIAKKTSIASVHTVQNYIQFLKNIFVLIILPFRYGDGRIGSKKNKKIHITDPFLQDAIAFYLDTKSNEADKVEAVVSAHLARISDVYYWRGKSSEVDVISKLSNSILGIEVKWSDQIRKRPKYKEPGSEIITLDKTGIALFLAHHNWTKS